MTDKTIEYLMDDGTIRNELTDEDQIHCLGTLIKEFLTPEQLADVIHKRAWINGHLDKFLLESIKQQSLARKHIEFDYNKKQLQRNNKRSAE